MISMIRNWLPSRTWILAGAIFGIIAFIYLGFYDTPPEQEVKVAVNGLPITEGEIALRMSALLAQDQQRGVASTGSTDAVREAAIHELVQARLIDYEIQNRKISRADVWDFLARVKPSLVAQVKARYLQILESRAIVLRKRFDDTPVESYAPASL